MANTKIWLWCTTENSYGNTWIYGRIDGTQTYGWLFQDNASDVEESPTVNEGWCPGEAPVNTGVLNAADNTVAAAVAPAAVDSSDIFQAGADLAPGAVKGAADETQPADDFVAVEGTTETLSAADAAAAAKLHYVAPIHRATVIARAKNWYSRNVPYSQSATAWDVNHGKRFRTDCSGYVSMTWALTSSLTTSTLHTVSHVIHWADLLRGDILLRPGHHVQLFEKGANSAHTVFWIYEEGCQLVACGSALVLSSRLWLCRELEGLGGGNRGFVCDCAAALRGWRAARSLLPNGSADHGRGADYGRGRR